MPPPSAPPYTPPPNRTGDALRIADLIQRRGDIEAQGLARPGGSVADLVGGVAQVTAGIWDRNDDQKAFEDISKVFASGEPFDAAALVAKYGVERTRKAYALFESMDQSYVLNKGQTKFDRNNKPIAYGGGDEDGGISADEKSVVEDVADAIRRGEAPPVLTGMYKLRPYVQASLSRSGYNLAEAETDWKATQRYLATMNGRPMIGLLSAATTADHSLDRIDQLVTEWEKLDKTMFGGDYQALNSVTMMAAVNGKWGPEVTKVAQALRAQITDVSSELGQMYMGGTSPTDHALRMGAENLNANWDATTIRYLIKQAKNNIRIRKNSLTQGPVGTGDNPYFTSQQPLAVDGMVEMWDPKRNRTLYVPEADVPQARIAGAVFPGAGRTPPVEGAAPPPVGDASVPWYAPPSQQPRAPAAVAPESFQFAPQPNASSRAGARFVPPPVAPPSFSPPGAPPPVTSPSQATPPTAPPVVRPAAPPAASVAPAAAPQASIPQSSVAPDGTVAMTNPRNGRPLRVPRAEVSAALAGGAVFAPVAGGQSPVVRPAAPPVQPPAARPPATAVTAVPPAAPTARPPVAAAPVRPQVAGPSVQPRADERRVDGTPKGNGWFGSMQRPDGRASSEITIGVNIDGREVQIPTMVPTLNAQELNWLMTNDISDPSRIPEPIVRKAVDFAVRRIGEGKSPFPGPGEGGGPPPAAAPVAPAARPPAGVRVGDIPLPGGPQARPVAPPAARPPAAVSAPPARSAAPTRRLPGQSPEGEYALAPGEVSMRDKSPWVAADGSIYWIAPGEEAMARNLGLTPGDIPLPADNAPATVGSMIAPPTAPPAPRTTSPAAATVRPATTGRGEPKIPAGYVLFRDQQGTLRGVVKDDIPNARALGWTAEAKARPGEHAMGIQGEDLNLTYAPKASRGPVKTPPKAKVDGKSPWPVYLDRKTRGESMYLMTFPDGKDRLVLDSDLERAMEEGADPVDLIKRNREAKARGRAREGAQAGNR